MLTAEGSRLCTSVYVAVGPFGCCKARQSERGVSEFVIGGSE